MQTIEEMLADVRADLAQRQQNDLENEKEKIRRQQAVAAAEKDLQDALARSDQEAYHAAEGRLTFARAHLQAFEAVNVWWKTKSSGSWTGSHNHPQPSEMAAGFAPAGRLSVRSGKSSTGFVTAQMAQKKLPAGYWQLS